MLKDLLDNFLSSKDETGQSITDKIRSKFGDEGARAFEDTISDVARREPKDNPPRIAVLGGCGVGKSTTINALFGAGLPVGHYKATTQEEHKVSVLEGTKGHICVYDMPGLGEDVEADKHHIETYARVLPDCDVAVWVLMGNLRQFSYDQLMIEGVISKINPNLVRRLVVAVNQIDLMQPGQWNDEGNLPSEEQEKSIEGKMEDVFKHLASVCPGLAREQVGHYSAKRRYRLQQLFTAMINACPEERRWVMGSLKDLAKWWELIQDPELRKFVEDEDRKLQRA